MDQQALIKLLQMLAQRGQSQPNNVMGAGPRGGGFLGGLAGGMQGFKMARPGAGMAGPQAEGMDTLGSTLGGAGSGMGGGMGAILKLLGGLLGLLIMLSLSKPSYAQVPLIGDNGIAANAIAGCPSSLTSNGIQFPVATWNNPQSTTIYVTGFSVILETANNVAAADVWASVYKRSDGSRLYNALYQFVRGQSYRANDMRQFSPNYVTLEPGDALLLEGGCVSYDTHPSADAGLVLNVIYSLQKP